jgi:AraC-like DNA-binding protein
MEIAPSSTATQAERPLHLAGSARRQYCIVPGSKSTLRMERLDGTVFETRHRDSSTLHYHRHRTSFVTIVLDGTYTEVRDGVPQPCTSRSLVVHGPNEEHADHFLTDVRCLNVELPGCEWPFGIVADDANLNGIVAAVVRAFYRDSPELGATVKVLRAALGGRSSPAARRTPEWLQPVLDGFAWCDATPLRDAARMAGVHPVQFSRAFHRHVGMTSNEYRRQARLRYASELLLASTASLARIAQHCGFADQSHLTRTFSETLGLSPAQYRRVFAR